MNVLRTYKEEFKPSSTLASTDDAAESFKDLLKNVYIHMRVLVEKTNQKALIERVSEQQQVVIQKRQNMRNYRQNYLKLLKHIKIAVCSKKAKESTIRTVLDQLEAKLEELKSFEVKKCQVSQPNDEEINTLKASYENSANQLKK